MSDLDQIRRNVTVMNLLTESYEAHQRGDYDAARTAMDRATEVSPDAVAVITGGMFIGEVPSPEDDFGAWVEYVDAQRAKLAQAEAEAGDE